MKTITINLNLSSIPTNAQPEDVLPCARVNYFTNTVANSSITAQGLYTESLEVEDDGYAGVDIFSWNDNVVNVYTDHPVVVKVAGDKKDQVQTTVIVSEAGSHDIGISIV